MADRAPVEPVVAPPVELRPILPPPAEPTAPGAEPPGPLTRADGGGRSGADDVGAVEATVVRRVGVYALAHGRYWLDTPFARWALSLARRHQLATDPRGEGYRLHGEDLAALQRLLEDAFHPPVYRIALHAPLLVFRFWGGECFPLSQLYTSLATVRQIPCFGRMAKELLGLTGRNSADHLAAVRIAAGSAIVVGGIRNRARWAD